MLGGEKYLYILGAGGEPKGPTTIFDESLRTFRDFAKTNGWKTQSLFNGGHETTEKLFTDFFNDGTKNNSFTRENFKIMLDTLKEDISSGKITPKDQILFGIYNHGIPNKSTSNEISHSIALALNEGLVSVDEILEISKIATDKGIRFAIIDQSCYSGASQKLIEKNPNLCVVTASSSTGVAFGNELMGNILRLGKTHRNLEDTYLHALEKLSEPNYPMISTEADKKITKDLQSLLGLYALRDNPNKSSKGSPLILTKNLMDDPDCINCFAEKLGNNFSEIEKLMDEVMKTLPSERKISFKEFIDSLNAYNNALNFHLLDYQRYLEIKSRAENILNAKFPGFLDRFSAYDLTSENIDSDIVSLQLQMEKATSLKDKAEFSESIVWLQDLNVIKKEALKILPIEVKDALFALKESYKNTLLEPLSIKLASDYRNYYRKTYNEDRVKSPTNPCREFILSGSGKVK